MATRQAPRGGPLSSPASVRAVTFDADETGTYDGTAAVSALLAKRTADRLRSASAAASSAGSRVGVKAARAAGGNAKPARQPAQTYLGRSASLAPSAPALAAGTAWFRKRIQATLSQLALAAREPATTAAPSTRNAQSLATGPGAYPTTPPPTLSSTNARPGFQKPAAPSGPSQTAKGTSMITFKIWGLLSAGAATAVIVSELILNNMTVSRGSY